LLTISCRIHPFLQWIDSRLESRIVKRQIWLWFLILTSLSFQFTSQLSIAVLVRGQSSWLDLEFRRMTERADISRKIVVRDAIHNFYI
jgi:hypothetical protein